MATNFLINCVNCHEYAFHVASIFVSPQHVCCHVTVSIMWQIHCMADAIFVFCHDDLWYLNTLWQFSGSWLDVVSSICCSMCCISARQFHPSTFLPLNKWHLIGVFLGQCVSCHILVFLMWRICDFLSYYLGLTWQLQHLLNCLMNCSFLMKPMCLVATFLVGQS